MSKRPSYSVGIAPKRKRHDGTGNPELEDPSCQQALSEYTPIAPANSQTNSSQSEPFLPSKLGQRRKRAACIDCRQAKVKCEGLNEEYLACSRCRELALECVIDSEYKRINKRLKINELAEEVKHLRSVVNQNASGPPPALDTISGCPCSPTHTISSDRARQSPSFRQQSSNLDASKGTDTLNVSHEYDETSFHRPSTDSKSAGPCSWIPAALNSQSLEHLTLHPPQISYLFRIYFEKYQPFFELLDPSTAPDLVHARCPILFWAIILVAARREEDDVTFLHSLTPCVKTLLWRVIANPPHSLCAIQAMLLLCIWPFPTSSMSTDITFILISNARSAAMHVGIHRPEALQDFSRVKCRLGPRESREAVKVWAGCFIAAESITALMGHQSLFQSDSTIDQACDSGNVYGLPSDLWCFLRLQRFCNRVSCAMAGKERRSQGRSTDSEAGILMTILEAEYEDLERVLGDELSIADEILLMGASLQFRVYYFFEPLASTARRQGILQAYETSLKLIFRMETENKVSRFLDFAPSHYHQIARMAAIIIMKTASSSYSRFVDVAKGKRAFNIVLSTLRRGSLEDNDLNGRVSKILAQLWSVHQSLPARRDQEPSLKVKTRLGASILHDSLWMWRETFGGQGYRTPPDSSPPNLMHDAASPSQIPQFSRTSSGVLPDNQLPRHLPIQNTQMDSHANHLPPAFPSQPSQWTFAHDDADLTTEFDWMWDVGFPSLIPVDIDYDALSSSTNTGGMADPAAS